MTVNHLAITYSRGKSFKKGCANRWQPMASSMVSGDSVDSRNDDVFCGEQTRWIRRYPEFV